MATGVSPCFKQFLRSLEKATLMTMLVGLQAAAAQMEVARIRALADALKIGNLKNMVLGPVSMLATAAFSALGGMLPSLDISKYWSCPTVGSLNKMIYNLSEGALSAKAGEDFKKAKLAVAEDEQKKEASKWGDMKKFADRCASWIQEELDSR